MIFFVGNDGSISKNIPSLVNQGADDANNIYLIAPFAASLTADVAFILPNGVITERYPMSKLNEIPGIVNKKTGVPYAGWSFTLPNEITRYYGTVQAQFYFYLANGAVLATTYTAFAVGQGVPTILPPTPPTDVYALIRANISAIQEQLDNGFFSSRALKPWNAAYYYAANELVFYVNKGNYGVIIKSLIENNNQPPYIDGAINSRYWQEEVDFDILNTLYDLKLDLGAAVEQAREYAENASNSATQAENSATAAQQSATEAAQSAASVNDTKDKLDGILDGTIPAQRAINDSTGNNIAEQFKNINEKIPSTASAENQLTDREFVNSSINNMAAFYITSNANGDAFATRAALINASTYYYGGKPRTPTQNDYAIVLADESQPRGADGNYPTTRYSYQGTEWSFQYVVNNTSLTQEQVNAINSGITASKIASMDAATAAKYTKPSGGIPETDLSTNVQSKLNANSAAPTKNLYNLGVHDKDNIASVLRQTGYVKLDGSLNWGRGATSSSGKYRFGVSVLSGAFVDNNQVTTKCTWKDVSANGTWNLQEGVCVNTSTEIMIYVDGITTVEELREWFSNNGFIYVQYRLDIPYTEKVIVNQPIRPANQEEEYYWHEEWKKGLNLIYATRNNIEQYRVDIGYVHLKPNKTYYLKGYGYKNVGNSRLHLIRVKDDYDFVLYNDYSYNISAGGIIDTSNISAQFVEDDYLIYLQGTYSNVTTGDSMLVYGSHAYPYESYYGKILREKDLLDFFKESSFELAGAAIENSLKKQGKLVLANLTLNNANVTITIPEGFRPKADINVIGYNNTTITIPANGVMKSGSGLLWGFANIGWETN